MNTATLHRLASTFAVALLVILVARPAAALVLWTPSFMQEALSQAEKDALTAAVPPDGRIQPKDFAFLYARGRFHVFYIRLNMWDPLYRQIHSADSTEKNLGHAVSSDLVHWNWVNPARDTTVLQVRPGKWDNFHVWAPSIVQKDSTYYLFYTGVTLAGGEQHQRIGVATSTNLDDWTRYDQPVLTAADVPWARKRTVVGAGQQLRDPFVMPDPAHAGQWLMYFVAVDTATATSMAVGVARSTGDLTHWTADANPMRCADSTHLGATRVESPHAFQHGGRWWLFYSAAEPPGHGSSVPFVPVTFSLANGSDPTDSVASHWSTPDTLYRMQGNDPYFGYYHASEHLVVGEHEYLAAYDDWHMGISIGEMNWYGPTSFVVGSASTTNLGVPKGDEGRARPRLALAGPQPAMTLRLVARASASIRARVDVYDVGGRRVATLLDRDLAAGETPLAWDGRDAVGAPVANGVYFARLASPYGHCDVRAVLLR